MKSIKFIEVDAELGAGTRGASLGIDAIKLAAVNAGKGAMFGEHPHVRIDVDYKLLYQSTPYAHAKCIDGIKNIYEKTITELKIATNCNQFPIVLIGDHSSAGGTIAGLKLANPDKRVGVIWIDAHSDLHSPYTTPSGNIHGMPLATALAEDNLESKINDPHTDIVSMWEELKYLGNTSPKINPEDLVFIALRDFEKPENHLIKKHSILVHTVEEVRKKSANQIVQQTLSHLSDCDLIHISFDIDSLDKSLVKGTGTPVENGLTEQEATDIILQLLSEPKIGCFELTEVNPLLDDGNKVAEIAFRILEQVIEKVIQR